MKKRVFMALRLVLIAVLLFSLGKIGLYYKDQYAYDHTKKEVEAVYKQSEKINSGGEDADASARNRIRSMQETYPNLVAWIEIPGTPLSLPVVQGKDNDYYLNHDINGSYNALGVPSMDYRNKKDFSDDNTIIYGHRVKNGKVFHPLTAYEDPAFVEQAPQIILDTAEGRKVYQIFAAYEASPYEDFRSPNYEGEKLAAFRARVEAKNIIKGPMDWQGEKIITLQTCTEKDRRMVVHGRLVEKK